MSFNGIGIPALFMGVSQVPSGETDTDYVSIAFSQLLGGKMPWWWHTSQDTIDKIDPEVLWLDTKIYLSTLWRLCYQPLLPMDFRLPAVDLQDTVKQLQDIAGSHLDLRLTRERTDRLVRLTAELAQRCTDAAENDIPELNRRLKALSRLLIPITYTAAGRFDHDPAWELPQLPTLSEIHQLVRLDPKSDAYHFLLTQLTRRRNRVDFALREALAVLENPLGLDQPLHLGRV